uniref:Insulin like growth factor binding protein 7 n=1 Tax=Chrysemys picta bellii TaxID=8478 RepID=A0A8C3HN62_CHRPI
MGLVKSRQLLCVDKALGGLGLRYCRYLRWQSHQTTDNLTLNIPAQIIRGQSGVQRLELLPGDRDNLAIQTRGGPEKHEVTGWVLISPLSKADAGEYECHASNSKGEATASARITVLNDLHEIPLTKGR